MKAGRASEANTASETHSELVEAVTALKSAYCRLLDEQQWDRWASLFTDNSTMQVGPHADAAVLGRDSIQRLLKRQLRGAKTLHQVHDPAVREVAPAELRVIWSMTDRVATPLYLLEGAGFYEDRYVRTEDGWKIAAVRLHRTKVDLQPKSFVMRAILWLHHRGWLKRFSSSADRMLGEALFVGLAEGERPP